VKILDRPAAVNSFQFKIEKQKDVTSATETKGFGKANIREE
jgi:hypothetical protein